jgi:hypothetical protein
MPSPETWSLPPKRAEETDSGLSERAAISAGKNRGEGRWKKPWGGWRWVVGWWGKGGGEAGRGAAGAATGGAHLRSPRDLRARVYESSHSEIPCTVLQI